MAAHCSVLAWRVPWTEEEMAAHCSILAWRVPWPEEEMAAHCSVLAWRVPWPEEEMAAHSSILAWRVPWTEAPVSCGPCIHRASDTTERAHREPLCLPAVGPLCAGPMPTDSTSLG